MPYLRAIVLILLSALSVLPYASAVILCAPFPHRYRYAVAKGWVDLNLWMLRAICGLTFEVVGRENIPERNGVVYVKHSSTFETMANLQVFGLQTWVLKRELRWVPIFGWALALLRPIAINRGARSTAVRQVIDQGRERLHDGLWVVIFPEGTRMMPGQTRRYGMSGALLSASSGRALVPVAHNAGDFWPRHSLKKKPGTIKYVVGPPIETGDLSADEINARAKAWIDKTMTEISVHHRTGDTVAQSSAARSQQPM